MAQLLEQPPTNGVCLWRPNPGPQTTFLSCPEREVLYGGAAGGGKSLCIDLPIPTPTGWKRNGDLVHGDWVFDETGKPCRVVRAFRPETPAKVYRLTFDDGSTIEASADHKWLTFDHKELGQLSKRTPESRARRRTIKARHGSMARGNNSPNHSAAIIVSNKSRQYVLAPAPTGTVRTTEVIARTVRTRNGRSNHGFPVAGFLMTRSVRLPVEPYTLGAWLGDGSRNDGRIAGIDDGVWRAIESEGYKVAHHTDRRSHRILGLTSKLKAAGVLMDKHIPVKYLFAHHEQRLEILRGLMDTDGTVSDSGGCQFDNTNRRLIDGVKQLVCSLGWKAHVTEGRSKLYGRDCGPRWRVHFRPTETVFRLTRKANLQRLAKSRVCRFRYLVKVERVKSVPMRCIEVDSMSHLYLAGEMMMPTHNSDGLLMAAVRWYQNRYHRAILFRKTFPELKDLIRRSYELFQPLGGRYKQSSHEWFFPSGAIVEFGSMERAADVYKYKRAWNFAGFDELTHWPANEFDREGQPVNGEYQMITQSRLRTPAHSGLPIEVRSATNPGGVGHQWVRARFKIPNDGKAFNHWVARGKHYRCFIPAKVADNPFLAGTEYEFSLDQLPDEQRKMLKDGRWDVVAGAMFSEFNYNDHVIDPFPIGASWRKWRGADDGFNAPADILWAAEFDGRTYIIQEVNRSGMNAETMGEETLRRDRMIRIVDSAGGPVRLNEETLTGSIDASAFNETGVGARGTGRAQIMNRMGCNWQPSQKGPGSRVAGCNTVHLALTKKLGDNRPSLLIFSTCKKLIETLPALPKDKNNPEDVDTEADDHPYDALRNVLQFKPRELAAQRVRGF